MVSRPSSHGTFVNESLGTSNAFWKVGFCSDETFHSDSAGHPTRVPYTPQGAEQLCCLSRGYFFWVTIRGNLSERPVGYGVGSIISQQQCRCYATALTVVAGDAQGLARNPLTPSTLPNKITQRSESLQDPPCALLQATWVNWHLWKQYPASHFEKLLSWEPIQHADNW